MTAFYILPTKLKGTPLEWRLCSKRLFLFPAHLRSKGTRPVRSLKHFFIVHNIILGTFSLSCKQGSCFSGWDFLQFGGCLTAAVVSCSHFVWQSFTWLRWKGADSPLPAAYLQAIANFSYNVNKIQYLIQYSQGKSPNFLITALFWTHVALKSKWKVSGL